MLRIVLLIYCLMGLSFAASAQSVDPSALDKIKADQKAATERAKKLAKEQSSLRADIDKYKRDLQRAAADSAKIEKTSRDIANNLTALDQEHRDMSTRLTDDQQSLSMTLAALQRISVNPPPSLLLSGSKSAKDAAMAATIMASVSDQLQNRATDLRMKIAALSELRRDIEGQKAELSRNETALSKKRSHIKSLVSKKSKLDTQLGQIRLEEKRRAEALAARASDLKALIAQFERTARDIQPRLKPGRKGASKSRTSPSRPRKTVTPLDLPDGTKRFADAKGLLPAPVQGRLTSGYGKGRKGLTIATRPGAQVLSPYVGRVEFAGTFKTYGEVVIINVGDNHFILLTGLGEIFVTAGEVMEVGEPVGLMPFNAKKSTDLYIEFRKSGRPINPMPWLSKAFG